MAVSRAEKETELGEIAAIFRAVDTAVVVDYRGVTVPQVTELRRQIRAVGASYRVVKNTLARRAAAGTALEACVEYFRGTTAVVSTSTDPIALAKTLSAFIKTTPTLSIKAAIIQGQPVAAAAVQDLAALPSREDLLARLLFVMQAPMQQLVTVLSAVPRDFVSVLAQYEQKQGDSAGG
jgi:large subunit ribosomal protein L10